MKIALAQTQAQKGNLEKNISNHIRMIDQAVLQGADWIVFPELSLTGYEPTLAKELAAESKDPKFDIFQETSKHQQINIALGMPTQRASGIHISTIVFQPKRPRQVYHKQHLHSDETPYFVHGQEQLYFDQGREKIALAICYESLLPEHAAHAAKDGATIYIASVAKGKPQIERAMQHYPTIAQGHEMYVLMANSVGPCDNFLATGSTAAWNPRGILLGQLDERSEGLMIVEIG